MRPNTLAQTAERLASGEAVEIALPGFLDEFYLAGASGRQASMLKDEPPPTGDARIDALLGAVAEYLAHQHGLPSVPKWAFGAGRYLERAWHASPFADAGFREYLTFSSPAEFCSRNIFTEESPLRRARASASKHGGQGGRPSSE
jgi:hypothetical protein